VINGQPFPSPGAPPLEDEPTRPGLHSLSKTVLLRAPPVVGLKGTLRHRIPSAPRKTLNLPLPFRAVKI
jgi:hypothetical protein